MIVRVLSEWPGSPKCGTVADVPDAMAAERIRMGYAEPVALAPAAAPVEMAVQQARVETRVEPKRRRR